MLRHPCPALEDIGSAGLARAVFRQGDQFVNVPLLSLREKLAPGRVPLDRYKVPSDGTDATAAFEAALTKAATDGVVYLQATEGGTYALRDATIPAGTFDIDWNGATIQGTYTAAVGSRNIITAVLGDEDTDFTISNFIMDGGWNGTDTDATASEKILAIKGYRRVVLNGFTLQNCAKGGASATVIFDRADMAIDVWNCCLTTLNNFTIKDTRRYEVVVIKSDDATHFAEVSAGIFLNAATSGSHFSAFNLGGLTWRDSYVDGANAGPNIAARVFHIDNVHLRDITDKGIDTFESFYYAENGLIENCSFVNIDDAAVTVSGRTTVRNCYFETDGVGIIATTELAANALESGAGLGDAAWGPWCAQTEKPICVTIEDNTFAKTGGDAPVFIVGTSSNLATAYIRGADRYAFTPYLDVDGVTMHPVRGVLSRHTRFVELTGSFRNGVEQLIEHDLGEGTYVLRAQFHPSSGAHVFLNERATAAACSATVYWRETAKRHGSLAASHYDIAKGSTAETYTAIHIEGRARPVLDPTNIASTVPIYRNGRWMQTINTDAAFTLNPTTSGTDITHTGTLTADRSVPLNTSDAIAGDTFRITRTGSGAFNLNIGTGPLKALATNTWCVVAYDGSAWALKEYGAL